MLISGAVARVRPATPQASGDVDLVGAVDGGAEQAFARAQIAAEPTHDERDRADARHRRGELIERDAPVGVALQGVAVFGFALAGADTAGDRRRRVGELAGAGDHDDGADGLLERVDGAEHFEGELRQAIAVGFEQHPLEDDVGDAAVGGGVLGALMGDDEIVGFLRVGAGVEPPIRVR